MSLFHKMPRALSTLCAVCAVAAPLTVQASMLSGWYDTDSARSEKPAGTAFHQALYVEYVKLSKDRTGDGRDAELFNHKALLASTQTAVQNDSPADRQLTADQYRIFDNAAYELRNLFDAGGRDLAPNESAVAQVSYDCWIEATEAKRQNDAAACKNKFDQAMAAARAKANRQLGRIDAPAPAPAPQPAPKPPQEYYRVGFEYDTTRITPEGETTLAQAIKDVKDIPQLKIALRAHADTMGMDTYNMQLSRRRAEAVLNRLAAAGIAQDRLRIVEAVGEARPLVPTADGVKEPQNRIVELDLRQ